MTIGRNAGLSDEKMEAVRLVIGRAIVNTDFRTSKLYRAVVTARTRLRDIEHRHEHMLDEGPAHHRGVGREYAAVVQDHTNAVMAWLSALETQGREEEMAPLPLEAEDQTAA
jgi:hypothetical protein